MNAKRYLLKENESELKEIEHDLALYLDVPFVKCSYDRINSHKYQCKEEVEYRKQLICNAYDTVSLDYVINYETYSQREEYDTCNNDNGGDDGEVYELHYFIGNGNYILVLFD